MKPFITSIAAAAVVLALTVFDSTASEKANSPYAGQEKRQIKSLSAKDVDDLLNGRGWGLAKAAELNGMPGPAHILEMADQINLDKDQNTAIQSMFNKMKAKAIKIGTKLVQLEKELDLMFANKSITQEILGIQLDKIAKVRSKLRQVHLETHLKTPAILTRHQIVTYNQLRGYTGGASHSGHSDHQ